MFMHRSFTGATASFKSYQRILGKLFVRNFSQLTSRVNCTSQHDALMNRVPRYDDACWLERISYNFLIRSFGRNISGNFQEHLIFVIWLLRHEWSMLPWFLFLEWRSNFKSILVKIDELLQSCCLILSAIYCFSLGFVWIPINLYNRLGEVEKLGKRMACCPTKCPLVNRKSNTYNKTMEWPSP